MSHFERKVLVLDSRYEPVKIVSLELGFVLMYTNRATVVVESDRALRSLTQTFTVPWILRLNNCSPKGRRLHGPRFSRQNVYLRDGYRCQYCNWSGPIHVLTLDHLIPSAKGGRTTWDNIVTACKTCNLRKGSRTLEELGLRLPRMPTRPQFHPATLFAVRFGMHRKNIPSEWVPYVDLSAADKMLSHIEHDEPEISGNPAPRRPEGFQKSTATSRRRGPAAAV